MRTSIMFAPPDQDAEGAGGKMQRVIAFTMPRALVERIDDFRYARHIPSRSEAIRELIEGGLKAEGFTPPSPSRRS